MSRAGLLLALQCRHAYFSDGVCRPLLVRPSAACMAQLGRYRMLWRPLQGGGEIHAPVATMASYNEKGPLTLLLINNDPYLMNYTGGQWPSSTQRLPVVWYVDNLQAQQGLLAPDPAATEPAYSLPLQLALMGRRFQWTPLQPTMIATLALRDASGQTILQFTPAMQQPQRTITLNLSTLDEGRYTLLLNGQPGLDFYLCDAPATALWGVCALYPGGSSGPAIADGAAIDAGGHVAARHYRIALRGRETHWRYTLIARGANPDYQRCTISGERRAAPGHTGEAIAFSEKGESVLVDGRQAMRYTSLQPLPLSEFPGGNIRITLRTGDSVAGQGSSLRLPYAQGRVLTQPDKTLPAKLYSDIYVYL